MSTAQIMIALRSLINRRGKPKVIYSDNASNFKGCRNQLEKESEDSAKLLGEAAAKKFHIHWKFVSAYSPWQGGAWERLIQSVKKSIDFVLRGETPTEDVLEGLFVEAEYHINRRPLTHTPVDPEDSRPLTPQDAIFGFEDDSDSEQADDNRNSTQLRAPGDFNEPERYSRNAHRRVQYFAQKFQHRWLSEYLPEITRRSKWHKTTKPIEVGDLVAIVEPDLKHYNWERGRVTKVYPGPDNIIRAADVTLPNQTTKTKRAVGKLAILDVSGISPGDDLPRGEIVDDRDQRESRSTTFSKSRI